MDEDQIPGGGDAPDQGIAVQGGDRYMISELDFIEFDEKAMRAMDLQFLEQAQGPFCSHSPIFRTEFR